jgi:hypothetical protein
MTTHSDGLLRVRALPQGLRKALDLFAERVSQLLVHRLVREEPLAAPSHLAAIFCGYGGLTISDPAALAPLKDRVDRMALNDLLRILRLFHLQSEPTHMFNLVRKLCREPIEDTLRRGASACWNQFDLNKLPESFTLRLTSGSGIGPASAFDLYLNGELFHSHKREEWATLNRSRLEPVLYSALLNAAVTKAMAVIELYRLLRVHGHLRPVPGDPTYQTTRSSLDGAGGQA